MNGTIKHVTRELTVDGNRVRCALELIGEGLEDMKRGSQMHLEGIKEVRQGVATLLEQLGPDFGERPIHRLIDGKIQEVNHARRASQNDAGDEPARRAAPTEEGDREPPASAPSTPAAAGSDRLGAGLRAILTAVAQWGDPTPEVLVVATGYRSTSVQTYLGELSSRALINDSRRLVSPRFAPPRGASLHSEAHRPESQCNDLLRNHV